MFRHSLRDGNNVMCHEEHLTLQAMSVASTGFDGAVAQLFPHCMATKLNGPACLVGQAREAVEKPESTGVDQDNP